MFDGKSMLTPFPHQQKAIDAVLSALSHGKSRILVQAMVGAGKTLILTELIRALGPSNCVLFAHRKELIEQAKNTASYPLNAHMIQGTLSSGVFPEALYA